MLRLMEETNVQRLFETTSPTPLNLHETLPPAVEREISASVQNATAASLLLKPKFLLDMGITHLSPEVSKWTRELRKQRLIEALKLPDGSIITVVTAGTCTVCNEGDAQTAIISKPTDGTLSVKLLCATCESAVLDHA